MQRARSNVAGVVWGFALVEGNVVVVGGGELWANRRSVPKAFPSRSEAVPGWIAAPRLNTERFGHTFGTPCHQAEGILSRGSRPCHWLPTATSTILFTPAPTALETPRRRRAHLKTLRWRIALLLGIVAMSLAAVAARILAGGNQVELPVPLSD